MNYQESLALDFHILKSIAESYDYNAFENIMLRVLLAVTSYTQRENLTQFLVLHYCFGRKRKDQIVILEEFLLHFVFDSLTFV